MAKSTAAALLAALVTAIASAAMPVCPLYLNGSKTDCGVGAPSPSSEETLRRAGLTRLALAQDANRGDWCFFGDSLARELYVELACEIGSDHSYKLAETSGGFPHIEPRECNIAGDSQGRKMRFYFDMLEGGEDHMIERLTSLDAESCGMILVSKGIWQAVNPAHKESVSEYEAELRVLTESIRKLPQQPKLIFKDTMATIFGLQKEVREICDARTGTSPEERMLLEDLLQHDKSDENMNVAVFNDALGAVASDLNVTVLGTYDVTRKNACDHVAVATRSATLLEQARNDPIHFCESSGALRQSVDVLLEELAAGESPPPKPK